MDEDLRRKIEAVLFSIGKKVNVQEIMRMTKEKDKAKIVACLIELKNKYNQDDENSLIIIQDGDDWKLTIKDQYIDVAKEIGVETELKKSVMETLAVIAYKNPVIQSDVIKIRTNKAYDHLGELEQLGYIERERWGRSKKIKLTGKFFEYFDLPPDSLKEKFKSIGEMEKAIEQKEQKIVEINDVKQQKADEVDKEFEETKHTNVYMKDPNNPNVMEVLEESNTGMEVITGEKLGGLEVFDESDDNAVNPAKEKAQERQKESGLEAVSEVFEEQNVPTILAPQAESTKAEKDEKAAEEMAEEIAEIEKNREELNLKITNVGFNKDEVNLNNEDKDNTILARLEIPQSEREDDQQNKARTNAGTDNDNNNNIDDRSKDKNDGKQDNPKIHTHHMISENAGSEMESGERSHNLNNALAKDFNNMKDEKLFPAESMPSKLKDDIDKKAIEIAGGDPNNGESPSNDVEEKEPDGKDI